MPSPRPTFTADDVHRVVAGSCFSPRPDPLVGVELEWLTFDVTDPAVRVQPDRLRACLNGGAGLPYRSALTFEPGGQMELSTPPRPSIDQACAAAAGDLSVAMRAAARAGVNLVGLGGDPIRPLTRVIDSPRYHAMERYFAPGGPAGLRMMCNTAAVHVNVGLGPSGDDVARQWRLANDLGPTLAAAFANSPLVGGHPSGFRSSRLAAWWAMDRTRTLPVARNAPPGRAWADYVLDANVMLIRQTPESLLAMEATISFREWLQTGHELGYPDYDDLDYHMTTLFPPVRPRGWLELRMIDALPDPLWMVALAVSAVLLLDHEASEQASGACAPSADLWLDAACVGLAHPTLAASAQACFAAARGALSRAGISPGVAATVAAFDERYVQRGRTPADDRLEEWAESGSLVPVSDPLTLERAWT